MDKKTALAKWDANVLPAGVRKKKHGGADEDEEPGDAEGPGDGPDMMKFTLLSRKGNKQQVRLLRCSMRGLQPFTCLQAKQLPIPASSSLAVHVRSAQAQDKQEQQQLKQLVLDYEHREEIEEMKGTFTSWYSPSRADFTIALEASSRAKPIRIRLAG